MIYDGHAYAFPDLRSEVGFDDTREMCRHLQLAIASHFQPVRRKRDGASADNSGLIDGSKPRGLEALREADFRPTSFGRFEWTVDGEDYVKQYMPPLVANMSFLADNLVAEMDHAGVDMALIHRTPYFGNTNDFYAECVRRYPNRLQALAYVEEWKIQTEPDPSISRLDSAIKGFGLHGLQLIPDHLPLYGQTQPWDSEGFHPFWDAFEGLDVPLFVTPSYVSLASEGDSLETYLEELRTIRRWMDRYPEVTVVLTHGFAWRSFMHSDGISLPDEVFAAAPSDHPNFYVQLLFPIFFGGVWDYPMPQIRTTLEQVTEKIGVDRLIWGTDIPMVMRFVTYRQSLDALRVNLDFLTTDEIGRIVGGNMARLMGVE